MTTSRNNNRLDNLYLCIVMKTETAGILKYPLLSPFEKKEVSDFIDFLFSKKKEKKEKEGFSDYKNKIESVSVWSEDDLKIFDENKDKFNQWPQITW